MGGELMDWFRRLFGVASPTSPLDAAIRFGVDSSQFEKAWRESYARVCRSLADETRHLEDWENEGGACYTGSSQPKEASSGRTEVP